MHFGMPVRTQDHTRHCRHLPSRIDAGRHAVTDQRMIFAHGPDPRVTLVPSDTLRARFVTLSERLAGPLVTRAGIDFGIVAKPHLQRIESNLLGQHVDRDFYRELSKPGARPTHPSRRVCLEPCRPRMHEYVLAGVNLRRILAGGLNKCAARSLRHHGLLQNGFQLAVHIRAHPNPMAARAAERHQGVRLLARKNQFYRPACQLAGHSRQQKMHIGLLAPKGAPRQRRDCTNFVIELEPTQHLTHNPR